MKAVASLAAEKAQAPWGMKAGPRVGQGLLGFDRRPAERGEDVRTLDPRASARWGQPVVRQREEERGGALHLLLDRSASLSPQCSRRDLDQRRLACALGAKKIQQGGRVFLQNSPQSMDRLERLQDVLQYLPDPEGMDVTQEVNGQASSRPTVFLTDPWADPSTPLPAHALVVIQVLHGESHPPSGILNLIPVEGGEPQTVHLDPAKFRQQWDRWVGQRCAAFQAHGHEVVVQQLGDVEGSALDVLESAQGVGLV